MSIGYSAAGNCWATQAEAIDAYYSTWSAPAAYFSDNNTGQTGTYLYYPHKIGSTWYIKFMTCNNGYCSYQSSNGLAAPTNITGTCTITEAASPGGTNQTSYDYDAMAQFWFFGLSIIVSFFVLGRGAGVVLDVFRK